MKHWRKILIFVLLFGVCLLVILFIFSYRKVVPLNIIDEEIGGKKFTLEIASNEKSRELGLGKRNSLGDNEGMIFVFDKLDNYGFWMKDTHFPLDILWLNENCTVVGKATMLPESFPKAFYPDFPAKYAIEFPIGSALNIKEGDAISCKEIAKL